MTHDNDNQGFADIAALTIHDVKNNLAQLAAEAETRGDLKSMQIALEASGTLSGLLSYYKSETHDLHVQIEPQDPCELIADLIGALPNGLLEKNKIRITSDLSNAPSIWFYDKTLIQMVLANVLQNALRYAQHQITITVAVITVEHAEQLVFQILDDGDGYPQTVLENLGDHSPVTRHGTGLGLRLAQRVVALHQNQGKSGHIHLSNHDAANGVDNKRGARFELVLP